jgi:prepilin-type N-terminal cleavage/methylation domain-containing protein
MLTLHAPSRTARRARGFTLIEVLLVIAIIAILAAIVIIAINPARQISQANNAQRSANVTTILNAIGQYAIDNRGAYPTTITTATTTICNTGYASTTLTPCVDLSVLTANQIYLPSLPMDPTGSTVTTTGYQVLKSTSANPRITVIAPSAELSATISVTR